MNYEDTRIAKTRSYLFEVLDTLTKKFKLNKDYQINVDMLSDDIDNYSLDKIPVQSTTEKFITGMEIHRDVYSFKSCKAYSQDLINNLTNVGFFEQFEKLIKENNKNKILPDIKGILKIECLNCATLLRAETQTAIFDIQIQITYREE